MASESRLSDRTDSPQIEMVSVENIPPKREGVGDPLTLPVNMIGALVVNETNNIEQRSLSILGSWVLLCL